MRVLAAVLFAHLIFISLPAGYGETAPSLAPDTASELSKFSRTCKLIKAVLERPYFYKKGSDEYHEYSDLMESVGAKLNAESLGTSQQQELYGLLYGKFITQRYVNKEKIHPALIREVIRKLPNTLISPEMAIKRGEIILAIYGQQVDADELAYLRAYLPEIQQFFLKAIEDAGTRLWIHGKMAVEDSDRSLAEFRMKELEEARKDFNNLTAISRRIYEKGATLHLGPKDTGYEQRVP